MQVLAVIGAVVLLLVLGVGASYLLQNITFKNKE